MNIITNEKIEISAIHKSVPIRDSDELRYCKGAWRRIEGGDERWRRKWIYYSITCCLNHGFRRIKRLYGWILLQIKKWKSVKSINPCPSVIQSSYDIVKAHGGELKVETKEGEGSEFIIQLPVVWITDLPAGRLKGLNDYADEQHKQISEIHKSVPIRDSDELWYYKGTRCWNKSGNRGSLRK